MPGARRVRDGPRRCGSSFASARSSEVLALSAICRYAGRRAIRRDERDLVEPLAHLAGLGVAHDDAVADVQVAGGGSLDRALDLAGALRSDRLEPLGPRRPGLPVLVGRPGRDVAAGE